MTVDPPKRFWKFLAFRQDSAGKQIDYMLTLLSKKPADLRLPISCCVKTFSMDIRPILSKPFQPHAVARTRHVAFQYNVVMKYLDNLIAWGDSLFQQDTIESIMAPVMSLAGNLARAQHVRSQRDVRIGDRFNGVLLEQAVAQAIRLSRYFMTTLYW